ncbi:kinase-like protein [Thermothelomyces heterothallicus CBS 203.75]
MASSLRAQSARLLRSRSSPIHPFTLLSPSLSSTNLLSQSRGLPRNPARIRVPCTNMSSTATSRQPLAKGTQVTSPSGKTYTIGEIIYQRTRGRFLCCLYRAGHEGKQYVLKDILPGDFQYILDLQKLVDGSAHVRTLVDSIPDRHMFIYPFLDTNLQLVNTAAIPPSGIYHTDIKPANIMMSSFRRSDGTIGFRDVQIIDLEDAVVLPPDSQGLGKRLSGNQFWRSPEAWARAAQHTPADIFSFGIVAIYVWLDRMVFFSDEANKAEDPSDMILKLNVSHFAYDLDDFGGCIEYHGGEDDPFVQRVLGLLSLFDGTGKKRRPFNRWYPVDPQFKDLISKMTCLDPRRRITAREALKHPWFSE